MEYRCEGFPQHGVVLLPPSSPEYGALLAEIQERLANPIPGSPPKLPRFENPAAPTMILCNRSEKPIATLSWIWKFKLQTGDSTGTAFSAASIPSVLAPFGLDDRLRKLYGYWHVILPGSKRGIRDSSMFGDNTDVRPPKPDELWEGGIIGAGGGFRHALGPLVSITLALDGVFFLDGGFTGPDTLNSFDRMTAGVDAHLELAEIARDNHNKGLSPEAIFNQIELVTGPDRGLDPPPPTPPGRGGDLVKDCRRNLASQISMMRQRFGDDRVIYMLMSWTETPLPRFHKL